jgi:hypothetical protein
VRIALCLHGYFGTVSIGDYSTVYGGLDHLREQIYSKCDNVDVFVHCWQPQYESLVNKFYSPVVSRFEDQIDFDKVCVENGVSQEYIDEGFPRNQTMYNNATTSRILSFYYSRTQSLNLRKKYEKENNFTYDWVITTRFDIGQRGGSEVNQIRFDPNSESDYLYTTDWNQKNCGYGDMWFYGSSEIMNLYSSIYDNALQDFKPESEYEKCLTEGWFDSKMFNVWDFNDPAQFSNELEKPESERSKDLMKFPRWRVTDSHLHHKWFCKKVGLYEKTRWV